MRLMPGALHGPCSLRVHVHGSPTISSTTTRTRRASAFQLKASPWPCHLSQSRALSSIAHASSRPAPLPDLLAAAAQGLPTGDWQQLCNGPLLHDYGKLFGAFIPVVLAIFVSHRLKMGLGKEMQIAIIRSSVQLISLGVVLKFVFERDSLMVSIFSVFFMVLIAGHTAGDRAKMLPRSHLVATLSLAIGGVGTLGLMIMLKVFPLRARFIIPIAGYVVGNSMSMVGGTLNRLHHDIRLHKGQIEAALALGASPQQAVQHHVQRAVTQGMGPMIDSIKTAGLISLPGSMTGMLMGGSSPLEAVQMQLVVLYMLLGGAALSSAISSYLGWHVMFTKSHQLSFS